MHILQIYVLNEKRVRQESPYFESLKIR